MDIQNVMEAADIAACRRVSVTAGLVGDRAEDEGRAFLLHPALEHFYPPAKRIVLPERLIVCGGVMLAEALDVLVKELARVTP
jgi:iron complex transport system substrate-binding protein